MDEGIFKRRRRIYYDIRGVSEMTGQHDDKAISMTDEARTWYYERKPYDESSALVEGN